MINIFRTVAKALETFGENEVNRLGAINKERQEEIRNAWEEIKLDMMTWLGEHKDTQSHIKFSSYRKKKSQQQNWHKWKKKHSN
jgi:hypothetical protein